MIRVFQPIDRFVSVRCDYPHIPYRVRQKMPKLQHYLIEASHLSRKNYRLILLDDGCFLYDCTFNKILWEFDYLSSLAILICRLEELVRFWNYENEKNCDTIRFNDYYTLQKKYGQKTRSY